MSKIHTKEGYGQAKSENLEGENTLRQIAFFNIRKKFVTNAVGFSRHYVNIRSFVSIHIKV